MQYRNRRTGAVQDVGENEVVKRRILERAGWRPVVDVAPPPAGPATPDVDEPAAEQPARRQRKGAGA